MALRALLIDFGGTLAAETPSRGELYARSARARGMTIDAAQMGVLMGEVHAALPREVEGQARYSDAWFEAFIGEVFHGRLGLARRELPALTHELFERFRDAASFQLFPGALELLDTARARDLRTALVSNWSAHLGVLAERLGLATRLDALFTSALFGAEKPDPRIFDAALSALGAAPHEALHAGNDVVNDVLGAARAGIEPILVDRSGKMEAPPGTLRVASLHELRDLVLARLST
jgi:HAD superfamily hydrolase (TIGR01549 family)